METETCRIQFRSEIQKGKRNHKRWHIIEMCEHNRRTERRWRRKATEYRARTAQRWKTSDCVCFWTNQIQCLASLREKASLENFQLECQEMSLGPLEYRTQSPWEGHGEMRLPTKVPEPVSVEEKEKPNNLEVSDWDSWRIHRAKINFLLREASRRERPIFSRRRRRGELHYLLGGYRSYWNYGLPRKPCVLE